MLITDPRKYVAWWLDKKKIVIDARGGLVSPDKREATDIFDTLVLDYLEQIAAYNRTAEKRVQPVSEISLKRALDEFISLERLHRREAIYSELKFNGAEDLTQLERYVKAVTGKIEAKVVGVLAHFIWQIKRRLNDKENLFHIMPIIYGPQGGGKSWAMRKLAEPLDGLTLELQVPEIADNRFYYALNRNFLVLFDEMSGAKKTDVDVLKKQISASHIDVRKLGTNMVSKIKQNASFIGTTNRPVNELIFDPTGARRFYEIKALAKLDWEEIESIDYKALFRGIDETRERGYLEAVLAEVTEDQKDLIGIDELVAFMDAHQLVEGTKEISAVIVYDAYRTWAENNGIKNIINSVWFGRKLKNKGISYIIKKYKGRATRFYLISEESSLHKMGLDPLASDLDLKKWN